MIATVKTVRTDRGYFFVTCEEYGDVLVHAKAFPPGQRNLEGIDIGMSVEIDDVHRTDKGYRAEFAKLVGMPEHVVRPPRTTNLTGRIARLRSDRGYGHIRMEPQGEVFFHCSSVTGLRRFDSLREGDVVMFDIDPDVERPRATNVQFLEDAA